ncbi:MAG TPA: bifunctional adenosylcobinamide kinase/adenosylcobinamide-phosphate guanylyltransferase [Acidimicrobiales bacterium]|nr:bifunctional adenosylcobinamide kinase/adenosylcobinamide-phosphate guanylyltransferase [Acidimicrobiales bacterium]
MGAEITLVLGGARSGKSEVAERVALRLGGEVTYVATGPPPEGDPEWAERVERHRARRPEAWRTFELGRAGDLAACLRAITGVALVDSLGTWVAGHDNAAVGDESIDELRAALVERRTALMATIVVSEEVGLGVHPSSVLGRVFRDVLGVVNRGVADVADEVLLVIAGRVLRLGAWGGPEP